MSWFAARLSATAPRRRVPDLVYAASERPPPAALVVLAVQHAGTAIAFVAYVLVVAALAGLGRSATQSLVTMTLLGMALATALQAWGGRTGSGTLLVHIPSPFMIGLMVPLLAAHGVGGSAGLALVYGATALAMAPLMRHLRPLFPPPVVGVVICMGGVALVAPSVRQALAVAPGHWQPDGASALIAAVTLGGIVVLSVWGGRLRLLALLLAMLAGVVVAALLGRLEDLASLQSAPVLALPGVVKPVFALSPSMMVGVVLVSVLTQLDTLGSVTMMDKMDDADWKRADMQMIAGGIRAAGLSDLVTGVLGGMPTATSSANIALAHATRSTARLVGLASAALLLAVALLPQLTLALTLMPEPVLGAVGLYAAGFLMVSGMELATSRALDSRAIFAIGLSLCGGLAVLQMPQLADQVPESLRMLARDGFVVAGVLVVTLNLLFRAGTSRRASWRPAADGTTHHSDLTDFVETQGARWGARRAVVQRAALGVLEASEAIAGAGRQLLQLSGHFDEFNLDLTLHHSGPPLPLTAAAAAPTPTADWLEDGNEQAMEAALAQMSARLLQQLADRVRSAPDTQTGGAVLKLHFEH